MNIQSRMQGHLKTPSVMLATKMKRRICSRMRTLGERTHCLYVIYVHLEYRMPFTPPSRQIRSNTLICLLGRLGSQLHHHKHQRIRADDKDPTDADHHPTIRLVGDVDSAQVIGPARIRANLTTRYGFGIKEIGTRVDCRHVRVEIGATSLTVGRVESRQFARTAVDWLVPHDEPEDRSHHIGEDVKVVEPVSPEGRDG